MSDKDGGSSSNRRALKAEILRYLTNRGHTNPTNTGVSKFSSVIGEDEEQVRDVIDEMIEEDEPISYTGYSKATVHITDAEAAKERANEILDDIYDL